MTEKLLYGYKLIRFNRYSYVRNDCLGGVKYIKNKKIYPLANCGPLAVFIKRYHAENFLQDYPILIETIIVSCTYKPSKRHEMYMPVMRLSKCLHTLSIGSCPTGTVLADFVTCKE